MIPFFLQILAAIPFSTYLSFFHDYFLSSYIWSGLAVGVAAFGGLYLAFRFSPSQGAKTNLLLGMVALSTAIWIFVISSLAFCVSLVQQYWVSAEPAIELVAKLALVTSFGTSSALVFIFRRRALETAYAEIYDSTLVGATKQSATVPGSGDARAMKVFDLLKALVPRRCRSISLYLLRANSRLPASLAFDSRRLKIVGLQTNVEPLLNDDELEGVLAHELGHIVNRDSLQKTIATGYRLAFPFDPLARLIEAAIYRNREIAADEFSARLTGKSASLASALLKIYESIDLAVPRISTSMMGPVSSQLSLVGAQRGSNVSLENKHPTVRRTNLRESLKRMLSKQPTLEARIERLLED